MIVLFNRLLTLWFDYGHISEVSTALSEGIKTIDIDNWLQVSTICAYVFYAVMFCFNIGYSSAHCSN